MYMYMYIEQSTHADGTYIHPGKVSEEKGPIEHITL